jgi:tetratricopeptide (TPR) repeat protein
MLVVWLFWPSLALQPSSLDDQSQLSHAAGRSFGQLWEYDQFGHFRPLKNVLFWLLSRDLDHIGAWRLGVLVAFMTSIVVVHVMSSRLLGSRWAGLAVASLWSLNPTSATVVCWLSTANLEFCLLGVAAYLCIGARALDRDRQAGSDRVALALAMLALLFAEFSHELALLAPIALLMYRSIFPRGSKPRWTHPVYTGSALCIGCFASVRAFSKGTSSVYRAQHEASWQLIGSAPRYLATNTLGWLWPRGRFGVLLSDFPTQHTVAAAFWWVALLTAAVVAWRTWPRDRVLSLGLGWYALFLAPVCNFVPLGNTPVAPHYMYVPGIGLALAVTRALEHLYLLARSRSAGGARAIALGVLLSIGFAWLSETRHVIASWTSDTALFTATLENYPDAIEPLVNLASLDIRAQRYPEAKALLDRAQRLAPTNLMVLRNVFSLLWQTNQLEAALDLLDRHAELGDQAEFLIRRGEALQQLDRHEAARAAFQRAFAATDPATASDERFVAGYHLMVEALLSQDMDGAREIAEQLLREYPTRKELEPAREILREGASESSDAPR